MSKFSGVPAVLFVDGNPSENAWAYVSVVAMKAMQTATAARFLGGAPEVSLRVRTDGGFYDADLTREGAQKLVIQILAALHDDA